MVGNDLEAPLKDCKLKSAAAGSDGTPPPTGWKYKTKTGSAWMADPDFKLKMIKQLPENGNITFSSSNPDLSLKVLGTYKPHGDFYSHGRRVFKHEEEELFLYGKSTTN